MSKEFIYACGECDREFPGNKIMYLCPHCNQSGTSRPPKGVLRILYNYLDIPHKTDIFEHLVSTGFIDLLPIASLNYLPPLRIGNTPLYSTSFLAGKTLPFELYLKDDSQNPTFSFKDRASALVSAFARERDQNTIIAASTGNAGSSLAGICAAQHQKAIVVVPASAPIAKLIQILMYGAIIVPVAGSYDDAFELSIQASLSFGWYNRNTAYNPITIEGKKTVSFELYRQMNRTIPDRIFVPVGDGVIISGVYRGFEDLFILNLIDQIPIIVAVQSEGSPNFVNNLNSNKFKVKKSHTIADSISVDIPRNFNMAKGYLNDYNGESVLVSDEEILSASELLARNTGIFAEPAAAATFAGMLKYHKEEKLKPGTKNVVLLTGSGLKDIQSLRSSLKIPDPIDPDLNELKKIIHQ
jgi:threonine synthase